MGLFGLIELAGMRRDRKERGSIELVGDGGALPELRSGRNSKILMDERWQPLCSYLDLSCFNRQRQPFFSTHFQAKCNGFSNIFQRFVFSRALTDTAWNGGAFGYPHTIFIAINGYVEFHLFASFLTFYTRRRLSSRTSPAPIPSRLSTDRPPQPPGQRKRQAR